MNSKPEEQGSKQLLATVCGAVYIPSPDSGQGQILFLRRQALMAQRFDEKKLELVGEPIPVVEQVGSILPGGLFSASTNGVLVYQSSDAGAVNRAMWFDRQGKRLGEVGEQGHYLGLALSPDGGRAAVSWSKIGTDISTFDLRLLDFARGTDTRFTFGQSASLQPVWSPDGSRIIFASIRGGSIANLYQKVASGVKDEELLLKSNDRKFPTNWSSEGRFLLYTAIDPKTKADLWVLPLEGDREPMPFLRTEFNELDGHFSPDMRWIAYTSAESGNYEIYVRGFSKVSGALSETSGKWQVSVGGGTGPRWRRDGKELYYRAPDGKAMVVEVAGGTAFQSGKPKTLFQAPPDRTTIVLGIPLTIWYIASDGNRFLLPVEAAPAPFTVVLNWQAGLGK